MRKRITALLFLFLLIFPSHAGASSVGDVVGHIYSTDIIAYVDGMLIPSYNIGGRTAIIAEDLIAYGFEVTWNEKFRILSIVTLEAPVEPPAPVIFPQSSVPGQIVGDIYHTDIMVTVNDIDVEAYNIGGKTAIVFDGIGGTIPEVWNDNYGFTLNGFREIWDREARISYLEVLRKGGHIEVDGNQYQISALDLPQGHGTSVDFSYCDDTGVESLIGSDIGIMDGSGGYFPESLLRQAFGDRWTLKDGKLLLDLRGYAQRIAEYAPNESSTADTYIFFYFASNANSPTQIPYITIPVTVIREGGATTYELDGAVYRGRILIDMDTFLTLL